MAIALVLACNHTSLSHLVQREAVHQEITRKAFSVHPGGQVAVAHLWMKERVEKVQSDRSGKTSTKQTA